MSGEGSRACTRKAHGVKLAVKAIVGRAVPAEELRKYICVHLGELTSSLLSEIYRPASVKRIGMPKPKKGKFRNLGIPTVIDRRVQQAVAQKLSNRFAPVFSTPSFDFRSTRSTHDAIFKDGIGSTVHSKF